jgi:sortase (surface protein transpeptidase)
MSKRTVWALVTVLGVLVAVGAPVSWALTRPPSSVGGAAAESLAAAPPAAPAATTTPASPPAAVPEVPVQDGRPGAVPAAGAAPVSVELPSVGVRAAIRPVGVDRAGDLEIPEDVAAVGWYRYGPRPGDRAGSTVLSGHVDSAEQGRGAFFRLGDLKPGDPVLVRGADGKTRRYRVVSREEWPKSEVPLDRVFARTGQPRITLVTCGGGFREDIRSYTDNIAVTAVPEGTR